jgi:hypothetical protein
MSGFPDDAFSLEALRGAAASEALKPGALAGLDSDLRLRDLQQRTQRMIERLRLAQQSDAARAQASTRDIPESRYGIREPRLGVREFPEDGR